MASADPHRFGRVDPDGTVWLITSAGERQIGSWQAGDTEAAFAHFGRRFDDLHTEVALMERRLASGTGDARKIKTAAAALAETLPTASVLGDVDALAARLSAIAEQADVSAQEDRARRDEHRAAQTARKEALAVEAEEIASNSTQWKAAGDRMREVLEEWRTVTGLDRKTDDALWKRYWPPVRRSTAVAGRISPSSTASGSAPAKPRKGCANAPRNSPMRPTGARLGATFRDLLTQWKAAGRASKEVDDALWARFKGAQDKFFSARNAVNAERDAEFDTNADAKQALLAQAEAIDVSDPDAARAAMRAIRRAGGTPSARSPASDAGSSRRRLRAVEKRVREARRAGVAPTDPEARGAGRAVPDRAAQYEAQAQKAQAAGDTKGAEQARASAAQWREWAVAAAEQAAPAERR